MGNRILVRQEDGILAAQRRLRELGRIRTGWSEPYTTQDGKERRRPVRSKTIVLTSAQRGCLDAAAQEWGGTVERWQPQGNNPEVWRLVTERDGIEAILPPGDPLNQTMEMWSGGGCTRRCDGETEKLSGKPCLCFAQFGPDFHEVKPKGGVPQVCRPHSRLSVFLDLPDFGLWRIETHSYYAMLEMAGTIDMIKARVGPDPVIPIRLRIDPRVRLADGKPTSFPVIVVELLGRGVVAQILSGTIDGLAIEVPAREAITAGPEVAAQPEVDADEPGPTQSKSEGMTELRQRIFNTVDLPAARELWKEISAMELPDGLRAVLVQDFWAQKRRLEGNGTPADESLAARYVTPEPWTEEAANPSSTPRAAPTEPVDADTEPDKVGTWMQVIYIAGRRGWNAEQTAAEMVKAVGSGPIDGDGWAMDQFLTHLKNGG